MDKYIDDVVTFLYANCKNFRELGDNKKSLYYFIAGLKLLGITQLEDIKTNNPIVIKFLEEFTIFSYYTNVKDLGLFIIDKLLFSNVKLSNRNMMANNQVYYMNEVPYVSKKQIKIKVLNNYIEMNPSIIKIDGQINLNLHKDCKYLMNCRTANFGVRPGGIYYTRTPDNIVNTINYILELDEEFNILSQKELIDKSKNTLYNFRPIKGLEDVILFTYDNKLWCTCTTLDTHPKGIPQISLCLISPRDDEYHVITKYPLEIVTENRPEKNWLPFSYKGQINFVYSYSPTDIRVIDEDFHKSSNSQLKNKVILSNSTQLNFERFRGSAGPLKFDINGEKGWLIVVHEVSWCLDNSRIYTHRFVWLTEDFIIQRISIPWYFNHMGLEFCRSMCDEEDKIILTCGIKDEEAWCYILDKNVIISMLLSLDYFTI